MKAAIISLNNRVVLKGHNIRSLESIYLRNWLLKTNQYTEIDYVSTKKKRMKADDPENVDYFLESETTDINDYDAVYVHNSTHNFIGGAIQAHTVKQTKELCRFKGPVYYMYTDPNLHLINFAFLLEERDRKGTKSSYKTDLRVTSEEVQKFANLPWQIYWCGKDFNSYYQNSYLKINANKRCVIDLNKTHTYPFFEFLFANKPMAVKDIPFAGRIYDLTYYGNWRPQRAKKIEEYFNNPNLSTVFAGFEVEWPRSKCYGYVDHDELHTVVQPAIASVVIGDPDHNGNIVTARFFENIRFKLCSFIDLDYDPTKSLYKDEFLKNFMYVQNKAELQDKVTQIKNDQLLFNKILALQDKEIENYRLQYN